ncbi:hypothetical protein GCK72_021495 [Caenorhabditis remanei]|uniref:Uncharacterized protein n=1 Tax=Caenorhabditis remanei TaxID=31234 RepID=A0A6A5GIB5_CAERE|nr:hypothetical protein GCK72_021495 [Caenorhabditis remanei]KAF1754930.1 hypothetical protein GCK72_021495 [Caenorhabditis remanei]
MLIERRTGFTNTIRVCFWIITALTFLCGVLVVTAFIVFDVGLCCKLKGHGNLSFGFSIDFLWLVVALYALSFFIWLLFVWKYFYHYIPTRFRQQQGY